MALALPSTSGVLPFETAAPWVSTVVLGFTSLVIIYAPIFLNIGRIPPQFIPVIQFGVYLLAIILLLVTLPQTSIFELAVNAASIAIGIIPSQLLLLPKRFNLPLTSYTATIVFHRWLGRILTALVLFHGIVFFVRNPSRGSTQSLLAADIAFFALLLLTFFSHAVFRRRAYEIFYYTHFLYVIFFIASIVHQRLILPYVIGPFAVYLVDRLAAWMRTRGNSVTIAQADVIDNAVVRIKFSARNFSFRPGQYVWVNFPSISRSWHPFSLSSHTSATIHIRDSGDFTKAVIAHFASITTSPQARSSPYSPSLPIQKYASTSASTTQLMTPPITTPMRVDGPYGHLSVDFQQYPRVLFMAGGIGITPLIAHLGCLLSSSSLHVVNFVWVIHSSDQHKWFAEELDVLQGQFGKRLSLTVFVTREIGYSGPFKAGRPDFTAILNQMASQGSWAVGLCGPSSFVTDAENACFKASRSNCTFTVHRESFVL